VRSITVNLTFARFWVVSSEDYASGGLSEANGLPAGKGRSKLPYRELDDALRLARRPGTADALASRAAVATDTGCAR